MGLFGALVAKLSRSKISDLDWDQARRELLASDIGPALTDHVIEAAKKIKGDDARAGLISALSELDFKQATRAQSTTSSICFSCRRN